MIAATQVTVAVRNRVERKRTGEYCSWSIVVRSVYWIRARVCGKSEVSPRISECTGSSGEAIDV